MKKSHLYSGFRFAGRLASVHTQREIQATLLSTLRLERILSVGCAYGDELAMLVSERNWRTSSLHVSAIDLAPVGETVRSQPFARALGERFEWMQWDLLDLPRMPTYGAFDLLQCGFVLHDVHYTAKGEAMAILAGAVKPGGYVIISDIFVSGGTSIGIEVCDVYDAFLAEAASARSTKRLAPWEWRLLVGDGAMPGLLRSKAEAMRGVRDFFDTPAEFIQRATGSGLDIRHVHVNAVNPRLQVMLMQRPADGRIDAGDRKGHCVL